MKLIKRFFVSLILDLNIILTLSLLFYLLIQYLLNIDFIFILVPVAILYYLLPCIILKKPLVYYLLFQNNDTNISFKNKRRKTILLLLGFNIVAYTSLALLNNTYKANYNIAGFNYYPYNVHLKVDKDVQEKIDFINNTNQSPKEYIFELFKTNDVVILGERLHPEMTQWDLIYDIVSDKRFIDSIGNLFTEYGAFDYQYLADEYFTTKYSSEIELDKATSNLLRHFYGDWEKTNIFHFFKKVNKLNQTLPDSLKIKEHFTGNNLYPNNIKTNKEFLENCKITERTYDSMMAVNVINPFKKIKKESNRKKCLVITNFRHSFDENKKGFDGKKPKKFKNEASYILKEFNGRSVNVLIHSNCLKTKTSMYWLRPTNNSSWDKAFEKCGNKSIGFNLEKSPFGEDKFDMIGKYKDTKYKDVATGYIFYKSRFDWWFQIMPPYRMDNFEKEYTRRSLLEGVSKEKIEREILFYKNDNNIFVPMPIMTLMTYSYPNRIIILYQFLSIIGTFILLVLLLKCVINIK